MSRRSCTPRSRHATGGSDDLSPLPADRTHLDTPSDPHHGRDPRTMSMPRRCSTVAPSCASVDSWTFTTSWASAAASWRTVWMEHRARRTPSRRRPAPGAVVDVDRDVVASRSPHREDARDRRTPTPRPCESARAYCGHRDQVAEGRRRPWATLRRRDREHQPPRLRLDEDCVAGLAGPMPAGASAGSSRCTRTEAASPRVRAGFKIASSRPAAHRAPTGRPRR